MTIANDPQYVKEELLPTFDVSAREAGKDPNTMERAVHFSYLYDPDLVVPFESIQQDAGTISGGALSRAMSSEIVCLFHSAEDIIKKIEELKEIGYNSVVVANSTAFSKTVGGKPLDEAASLKVWEDVLPNVR